MFKKIIYSLIIGFMVTTLAYGSAEEKVLDSSNSLKNMLRDSKAIPLKVFQSAQAIAIFPGTLEISMFLGGKSGNGVMVVRKANGAWSSPLFVKLGGAGFGLQLGVEKKDILMVFKSKDSVKKMMGEKITLGVDASVAVGPAGESVGKGSELDFKSEIYTYTKTEGLFVGFSLDGSVMSHDFDQNVELYGNDISPEQIVESDDLISSYAVDEFLKTIQMITE